MMWLLCSAWMAGVWWIGHGSVAPGPGATLFMAALGAGALFLLFLLMYLRLALHIELGKLRTDMRAVLEGASVGEGGVAPEWRGLLHDLRLATQRQRQEIGTLRERVIDCEQERDVAYARARDADAAVSTVCQSLAEAKAGLARSIEGLAAESAEREAAHGTQNEHARHLLAVLTPRLAKLEASLLTLRPLEVELSGRSRGDDLCTPIPAQQANQNASGWQREAERVADALHMLGLNFRLALERLDLQGSAGDGVLETIREDLEPLCAEAAGLQKAVRRADQLPREVEAFTGPASEQRAHNAWADVLHQISTFRARAEQDVRYSFAAMQQFRADLEAVCALPAAPSPSFQQVHDARMVIETLFQRLDPLFASCQVGPVQPRDAKRSLAPETKEV